MALEDAEAFLSAMVAPLGAARRGRPLPGVPFSREAAANALSGGAAAGEPGWRGLLKFLWVGDARQRARAAKPDRAELAVRLPLRQAAATIESIVAHEELVSIQLRGYPWVSGEYWPMIAPCFQVRAVDAVGGEYEGVSGSGGGSPEGSFEFAFWPPVPPAVRQLRVTVSTLWEAARAEIDIPGRSA